MGYGALLNVAALLFLLCTGLAARGAVDGDAFVVGSIALVVAVVALFIVFPIGKMLASASPSATALFGPASGPSGRPTGSGGSAASAAGAAAGRPGTRSRSPSRWA